MTDNVLKLASLKKAEIALTKKEGVLLKYDKNLIGEGDTLLAIDNGYIKFKDTNGGVYAGLCLTKPTDFVCIVGTTYAGDADYDYIVSINKMQEIDSAFCPNQDIERYVLNWDGIISEFISSDVAENMTIRI